MMRFRSTTLADVDGIYQLTEQSGVGITTLPKCKELLAKRIEWSVNSFAKNVTHPGNEYYLFVLEDMATKQILGTSAIEAFTGYDTPFYSYKVSKYTTICYELNLRNEFQTLTLVNDKQGLSELCTLFLHPDHRKGYNGLLLSKARFLFIASHRHRFAPIIIAEMRGVSNESGHSPFWDQLGAHFFHMPFAQADSLTLSTNKQFIADLVPKHPIYINLLSKAAREVIGKPHSSSTPAMNILLGEGFYYNDYVDIFDAGPTIEAPIGQIKTVANSKSITIEAIKDSIHGPSYLLTNEQLHFYATISKVMVNDNNSTGIINSQTAELLQVQQGDTIRISPFTK